ncbi:MAG: type III-B CRISPR module RAMP protein Cmr6 [Candidatus Binatia bacterium]
MSAIERWADWPAAGSEIHDAVARELFPREPDLGNPGLAFSKFGGFLAKRAYDRAVEDWRKRGAKPRREPKLKDQKRSVLDALAKAYRNWSGRESDLLKILAERSRAAAQTIVESHPGAELIDIQAGLLSRMTSRLGEAHAFEIGFMFHPLFGVPYLPGSGFKGAVRFAYWARWIAEAPPDAERDRSTSIMRLLFGSSDEPLDREAGDRDDEEHERGTAVFFDIFPPADAQLEVDVLNPHFARWYQEQGAETDDQNPVPNFLLTVAAHSLWRFSVVLLPQVAAPVEQGVSAEARERLRKATEDCLQLWGLGAKTSAGYGLFDIPAFRSVAGISSTSTSISAPGTLAGTESGGEAEIAGPVMEDAFLSRLRSFQTREFGQLRQLVQQCESRPDRDTCLGILATRLLALYGTDKKQLKTLREKFPALAPHLTRSFGS